MKLDARSFLAGALVVVMLWAAFAGSRAVALDNTPQMGGADYPPYELEIGPQGEVYVMYCPTGLTRRVFQQNGRWVCEIVAPRVQDYRRNVVTKQQAD